MEKNGEEKGRKLDEKVKWNAEGEEKKAADDGLFYGRS